MGSNVTYPPDGIYIEETNTYQDGHGQTVRYVHSRDQCTGRHCAIHSPSDHHMRGWPTLIRPLDIKPLHMERVCPHGVGHPDPDDLYFWVHVQGDKTMGVHGCDGCCNNDNT